MSHDRISGSWHNEQGSQVRIEVGPEGRLSGRFVSGVGLGSDEPWDLTGFVSGNAIAFTVSFGKVGSLTSWVGHLIEDEGGDALQTLWQMTIETPHPKAGAELWKTIWSGANTFRRGPAPSRKPRQPLVPLWMP